MPTKTDKKPSARQVQAERRKAETQLATVKAQLQTRELEEAYRQLVEAPQPVSVPWHEYPQFDEFSQWPSGYGLNYYWSSSEDRIEGRYRPLYETEQDLRRIRAQGRKFKEFFPVAESALEALTNYIMSGCEIVVQPKETHRLGESLAPIIQKRVDKFLEYNNFVGDLDRQIHIDSRVDGEVFATLYPEHEVRLELTDPDFICTPLDQRPLDRFLGCGHKLNFWWHGVHTQWNRYLKRDDTARPLGYHAVYDRTGEQWDYLTAMQVERVMRNVGRMSRRGVSDFHIIMQDLANEAKLRRNTALGAAILAAIVMIREHAEGVSKTSIESMVSASSTRSYEKPIQDGTRTTYREDIQPGTVKDTPFGMKMSAGPLGVLNQPVYIEVAQYVMRIIGNRWCMPEYLISGDASNANYSSTLVAESPFVKYCEHQQEMYAAHFKMLIWKALKIYYDMGRLPDTSWQTLEAAVEIDVNYASPASRDGLQQAQENQILCDAGLLSKRTWATNAGLDFDEEQQNIEQDGGCGGACSCGGASGVGGNALGSGGGFGNGSAPMGGYAGASSSGGSGGMAGSGAPAEGQQMVDAVNEDGEVIGQAVVPTSASGDPSAAAPVVIVQATRSGRPAARPAFAAPRPAFRPTGRPQFRPDVRDEFRTETLALRAMDLLLERAEGDGKWVTINGTPVKLSKDGKMLSGPLKGKELKKKGSSKSSKEADEEPVEKKPRLRSGSEEIDLPRNQRARVSVNPPMSRIEAALERNDPIRILVDQDQNVFMWPAEQALHSDIARAFDSKEVFGIETDPVAKQMKISKGHGANKIPSYKKLDATKLLAGLKQVTARKESKMEFGEWFEMYQAEALDLLMEETE